MDRKRSRVHAQCRPAHRGWLPGHPAAPESSTPDLRQRDQVLRTPRLLVPPTTVRKLGPYQVAVLPQVAIADMRLSLNPSQWNSISKPTVIGIARLKHKPSLLKSSTHNRSRKLGPYQVAGTDPSCNSETCDQFPLNHIAMPNSISKPTASSESSRREAQAFLLAQVLSQQSPSHKRRCRSDRETRPRPVPNTSHGRRPASCLPRASVSPSSFLREHIEPFPAIRRRR